MDHQNSEVPEKLERIINVDCDACGSEMVYSANLQSLECKHCSNTRNLPKESDMVVERSYSDAINLKDQAFGYDVPIKEIHCKSCGSRTAISLEVVSIVCPFCGSDKVNQEAHESRVIRPEGILPFKIDKKVAVEEFKKWIKKGWFRPGSLKKIANLGKISGVYVPFWTYDAFTQSSWNAMAGYYYYVSESYTGSDGRTKTRQVRRTRWVPASGYYEHQFDDVLVLGSNGLEQSRVNKIYPFDLSEVVNYDGRYILGFSSEVYQLNVNDGFQSADSIMDNFIRSQCVKQIPGDTHQSLHVNTRKSNITFKHLLLPIWISAYQFNKKVFQFIVNGQTGKISGKKPISISKILFAIVIAVSIGVGVFLIFGR